MRSDNCPISGHPCQSLCDEPCNKSCAPGYCYCEQQGLTFTSFIGGEHQEPRYPVTQPIIKPEIKVDNAEPVAWMVYTQDGKSVCVTDNPADFTGEHRALPLYTAPPRQWQGLTNEEVDQMASNAVDEWDCARAVEEKLRAKNSTLACIPAVPPG
jgi:hypothetical protein